MLPLNSRARDAGARVALASDPKRRSYLRPLSFVSLVIQIASSRSIVSSGAEPHRFSASARNREGRSGWIATG